MKTFTIESDFGPITSPRLTLGLAKRIHKKTGIDLINLFINASADGGRINYSMTDLILHILDEAGTGKTIDELADAIDITALFNAAQQIEEAFQNFSKDAVTR